MDPARKHPARKHPARKHPAASTRPASGLIDSDVGFNYCR